MLVEALRFFNAKSLEEAKDMTLAEYQIYSEVYQLKQLDRQRDIYEQAWANQAAKATKKSGKPYYRKFDDFFGNEYDKQVRKVMASYQGAFDKKAAEELHRQKVLAKIKANMKEYYGK